MSWDAVRVAIGVVLASACLVAAAPAARAELYRTALDSPSGVGVVRDTESGLDWLRLHYTAGVNMTAILGGQGGWIADGWRYATRAEVCEMLSHVFEVAPAPSCAYPGAGVGTFFDLFGLLDVQQYPSGTAYASWAYFEDDDPSDPLEGELEVIEAYEFSTLIVQGAHTRKNALFKADPFVGSGVGSLLVRDSPAPASVPALGGSGQLLVSACLLLAGAAGSLRAPGR